MRALRQQAGALMLRRWWDAAEVGWDEFREFLDWDLPQHQTLLGGNASLEKPKPEPSLSVEEQASIALAKRLPSAPHLSTSCWGYHVPSTNMRYWR